MPICAFCGKMVEKVTDDHLPPKAIFGLKPDYNLITVPSCDPCNRGTSMDDEYFKLLATESKASETPVAWHVNDSTAKKMARTDKPKYGNMIRSKMRYGPVYTEGGIYIGQHHTIAIDYKRILNTVEKIIRGLYYKHTDRPLPEDHAVYCHLVSKVIAATTEESKKGLDEILAELNTKMIVSVGPKVFRYRYAIDPENQNAFYKVLTQLMLFGLARSRRFG